MGLWARIRVWFIREDEPGLGLDDERDVSAVQYPRVDLPDHGESPVDEQREGEGFR